MNTIARNLERGAVSPEEVRTRVEAYLRAWRIGNAECAGRIVAAAQRRSGEAEADLLAAAIDEADLFLKSSFEQSGAVQFRGEESSDSVTIAQRAFVLFGTPADAHRRVSDRTELLATLRQGSLNFAAALRPARVPETRAFTMQTSLSRLPSIQLIAGWILLIAMLFLAFVLTHHRI